jgi:putative hydrolase of the HAD superfamily
VIHTVVFDLDDVILPTPPIFGTLAREHGIRANPFRRFLRGAYRDTLTGEQELLELLPAYLERWAFEGTPEHFLEAWFAASAEPDPSAVAIVRTLREAGVACAVASNQDRHRGAFLETLPLLGELFSRRLYSHALGVAKPSPAFFRAVSDTLDLAPERLLLLDDAERNVKAARACRWQAETCPTPYALLAAVRRHFGELAFPEAEAEAEPAH